MIPLNTASSQASSVNTVMPPAMMGPGPTPNTSLNLDEKKRQKKAEEEKKKKKIYTYLFFGISVIALTLYSVYFFYPYLTAYLKAPKELEQIDQAIVEKNDSLAAFQEEKSLHQAAYEEENERKTAIVDVVYPTYSKQAIVRDIENAINALDLLGTFEMNSITLDPPISQGKSLVTLVSGNFKADKAAFDAFIDDYVGNSGNLDDANSTILKEVKQISIRPIELKSVSGQTQQAVSQEGYSVSFKLAFYTQKQEK